MAYKIKSFTGYNSDDLENKINHWLAKNEKIEIVEISQGQNSEGEMVIFVFYQEK
ncbi:MAG: hypothetical protein N2259_00025 [Patescibacteria group bacterium]|nr:hypothetical protein [Patescibacteria group bacterium]